MTTYSFSGEIRLGKGAHTFEREIEAESEKHAEEILYSQLGSEHSINRGKIQIDSVEEV